MFYGKNDAEQQEIRETLNIPVPDEVLQVHGYDPPTKAEGTVCLIYENVNGINNRMCNNEKLERMREIHNKLKVNIAAHSRHRLNMKNKNNCNGFNQLFKGGKRWYIQSLHTKSMKILARSSKEVQASLCADHSQISLISMRTARTTQAWDAGQS